MQRKTKMSGNIKNTMENSIKIRHYRSKDRQSLEDLATEVQEYERALDKTRVPGKQIAKRHVDRLLKPIETREGIVLIAEFNGKCIGYIAVHKYEDFMDTYTAFSINDLGVTKAFRGQGIGAALLKETERIAREEFGLNYLKIGVMVKNEAPHRLYKCLGYSDRETELVKKIT
jgi:GNAT superfamily N-acetyltransferase